MWLIHSYHKKLKDAVTAQRKIIIETSEYDSTGIKLNEHHKYELWTKNKNYDLFKNSTLPSLKGVPNV